MITTAMIKALRERTSAGLMDCKKALGENDGDLEAAADWLRKKGLADAARKAGRIAAEGLVAVALDAREGVLVELNAETDFVSRSAEFQDLARWVAGVALASGGDADAVLEAEGEVDRGPVKVADRIREAISTIGENMALRRVARIRAANGRVVPYLHNVAGPASGVSAFSSRSRPMGSPRRCLTGSDGNRHARGCEPAAIDIGGGPRSGRARAGAENPHRASPGVGQAGGSRGEDDRRPAQEFVKESCLLRQLS